MHATTLPCPPGDVNLAATGRRAAGLRRSAPGVGTVGTAPARRQHTTQGAVNVSGEIFTIYTVKNVASGQCLTVPQTDNPAGLSVLQEPCSGGSPDIYWILEPRDQSGTSPDFQLESEFVYIGHYCMASNTFTDNNGTRLIIEPCNFQDTSRVWNLG